MGEGFQFIDIILFAMIAAFLVLRLRSVLGRRDGHEGGHRNPLAPSQPAEKPDNNVVNLPDKSDEQLADDEDETGKGVQEEFEDMRRSLVNFHIMHPC